MLNQDWDIKPRGLTCGQCQTPFADQQAYMSRLVYGTEGYARLDFCLACWTSQPAAAEAVSVWKGTFQLPPPAPPKEPIQKETAENLLRRLMETNDLNRKNVVFILAVMLERRRLLVERDVQQRADGATVRVYEHRQTGETFLIPDPLLNLDQIEQVQEEVVAMLNASLPANAAGPAAAGPASPAAADISAVPSPAAPDP